MHDWPCTHGYHEPDVFLHPSRVQPAANPALTHPCTADLGMVCCLTSLTSLQLAGSCATLTGTPHTAGSSSPEHFYVAAMLPPQAEVVTRPLREVRTRCTVCSAQALQVRHVRQLRHCVGRAFPMRASHPVCPRYYVGWVTPGSCNRAQPHSLPLWLALLEPASPRTHWDPHIHVTYSP